MDQARLRQYAGLILVAALGLLLSTPALAAHPEPERGQMVEPEPYLGPVGAQERAMRAAAEPYPAELHCTPKDSLKVLYGYYRKRTGNQLDDEARAAIVEAIEHAGKVIRSEGIRSADGDPAGARHLRVRCDRDGQIEIFPVALEEEDRSFGDLIARARAAGHRYEPEAPASDPRHYRSKYAFYIEADNQLSACGGGSVLHDDRLAADNANNTNPEAFSMMVSDYFIPTGDRGRCWNGFTTLHEIAHSMGAVQRSAPTATSIAHCVDEHDVMCYNDRGLKPGQSLTFYDDCPQSAAAGGISSPFDCHFDTYFDAAPEPGEYLASHWNLGSPLNRYLSTPAQFAEPPFSEPIPKWTRVRVWVKRIWHPKSRRQLRRRGVQALVYCYPQCNWVTGRVVVSRPIARRLRLGSRVLARGVIKVRRLANGRLRMRLTRRARRGLREYRGSFRAKVVIRVGPRFVPGHYTGPGSRPPGISRARATVTVAGEGERE